MLILSRFAGAAGELREALIVNPHDIAEVAEKLQRALSHAARGAQGALERAERDGAQGERPGAGPQISSTRWKTRVAGPA